MSGWRESGFFLDGDLRYFTSIAIEVGGHKVPKCDGANAEYDGCEDIDSRPHHISFPQQFKRLQAEG